MLVAGTTALNSCLEENCGFLEIEGESLDGLNGCNAFGVDLEVDGFPRTAGYQGWAPVPALIVCNKTELVFFYDPGTSEGGGGCT